MNVYMEENLKEPMDKLLELVNEFSTITSVYVYIQYFYVLLQIPTTNRN